jgi:hypothetical protein
VDEPRRAGLSGRAAAAAAPDPATDQSNPLAAAAAAAAAGPRLEMMAKDATDSMIPRPQPDPALLALPSAFASLFLMAANNSHKHTHTTLAFPPASISLAGRSASASRSDGARAGTPSVARESTPMDALRAVRGPEKPRRVTLSAAEPVLLYTFDDTATHEQTPNQATLKPPQTPRWL